MLCECYSIACLSPRPSNRLSAYAAAAEGMRDRREGVALRVLRLGACSRERLFIELNAMERVANIHIRLGVELALEKTKQHAVVSLGDVHLHRDVTVGGCTHDAYL